MKGNVLFYRGAGKVGNMVGYVKGGVQMFRAKAESVYNPRTARQELSRAKLALASELARGFSNVLRLTYAAVTNSRVSARNIFVKQVVPVGAGIITGQTPSTLVPDYVKMPIASGTRSTVGWDEPDVDTPLLVKVGITEADFNDPNLIKGSDGSPRYVYALVAVYCPEHKGTVYSISKVYDPADATHAAPSAVEVVIPTTWQGMQCELYGVTCQAPIANNGIASGVEPTRLPIETSPSQYLGRYTIA